MTRSDINNISKLFLESTTQKYYVYCVGTANNNQSLTEIHADNIRSAMHTTLPVIMKDALIKFTDDFDTVTITDQEALIHIGLKPDFTGDCDYLITPRRVKFIDTDVDAWADAVYMSKSATRLSLPKFESDMAYRDNALQGSNDEAGLGDVLDVL